MEVKKMFEKAGDSVSKFAKSVGDMAEGQKFCPNCGAKNEVPEEQPEETKTESVSEEEVEILSTEETKTEDTPDQPSES